MQRILALVAVFGRGRLGCVETFSVISRRCSDRHSTAFVFGKRTKRVYDDGRDDEKSIKKKTKPHHRSGYDITPTIYGSRFRCVCVCVYIILSVYNNIGIDYNDKVRFR